MSTTPNLLLSHIAASQNQKEVTANAFADGLDEAMNSGTSVPMTDADYTFATGAGTLGLSNVSFIFTGALSQNRNVILPPNAKIFIVRNSTTETMPSGSGNALTFKVGTFTKTVMISDDFSHLLYSDGVGSIYEIGGSSSAVSGDMVHQVTLSTATLEAMNATPALLVPAGGAKQVIAITEMYVQYKPGGTPFVMGNADNSFLCFFGTNQDNTTGGFELPVLTGFIDQVVGMVGGGIGGFFSTIAGSVQCMPITGAEGQGVYCAIIGTTPGVSAGNGSVIFTMKYKYINLL